LTAAATYQQHLPYNARSGLKYKDIVQALGSLTNESRAALHSNEGLDGLENRLKKELNDFIACSYTQGIVERQRQLQVVARLREECNGPMGEDVVGWMQLGYYMQSGI
jgi:hypothetical protein